MEFAVACGSPKPGVRVNAAVEKPDSGPLPKVSDGEA
jgi:hypothetical protein